MKAGDKHACFFLGLYFNLKMEAIYFFESSVDSVLQGVISQKMVLFITTAVKTSNPTI
jgi:hypothetical protein